MPDPYASGPPPAPYPSWFGLPPYVEAYRQRGRTALVALVAVAGALGVAATLLLALTAGEPAGSGLALLYAMLPVPFLVGSYFWLDRYEREPLRYKFAAFVWGAVVAVAIALILQLLVAAIWDLSDNQLATFVAPATEEPAKCAFLLLLFARKRRVLDGFVDALVFAGLVGLGFAFVENVLYYAGSYLGSPDLDIDGATAATATFFVRGIMSPFAHPLFTSAFGIALGFTLLVRSKTLKFLIGTTGLALSMSLHGAWNGSLSYYGGGGFLIFYLLSALVFVALVATACLARKKQGDQLAQALWETSRRGWLHPDEVPYLSRFALRRNARQFAKGRGGPLAVDALKRYQQLAVTMAFLYAGVMVGRPKPQAVPKVYALRGAMESVKPLVMLPPPVRPPQPVMPYPYANHPPPATGPPPQPPYSGY